MNGEDPADLEQQLLRPNIARTRRARVLEKEAKSVLTRVSRAAKARLDYFNPFSFHSNRVSNPQQEEDQTTPFEQSFLKLLTGAQYNLETVGPYARLHLTVHRASKLLAQDICGTSDPYVEVYVNDVKQGQSRHVNFTLNPQWNYSEVVDIWSPFSIITLRIVDWDRVSKDDPIGFVDFCVADLEPNGTGVRGWLEVRKMKHMATTAKKRFLEHRRLRDDDLSEEENEEVHDEEGLMDSGTLPALPLSAAAVGNQVRKEFSRRLNSFHFSERKAKLKTSMKAMRSKANLANCCRSSTPRRRVSSDMSALSDGGNPPNSQQGLRFLRRRKAKNAGEVEVSLRLETTCKTDPVAPLAPMQVLYTAVMAPSRIRDVVKSAEWFACCLPEPTFNAAETWSLASIKMFAEEVVELLEMLLQVLIIPPMNIILLILGWYYWPLSVAALLYFWAAHFSN
eukprot:symbB.v1.2.027545.t1/scaffold2835.1/size69263/2